MILLFRAALKSESNFYDDDYSRKGVLFARITKPAPSIIFPAVSWRDG